jgi:beta-xylosidase
MRKSLCLAALAATTAVFITPPSAVAAAPSPVFAPANGIADPGVVRNGGDFYAFSTGTRAPVSRGDEAAGPWRDLADPALSSTGSWTDPGAVWAPDAVQTSAGWVLYYAAPARGMDGQRCIGTAVSASVGGPYTPSASPLICPGGAHGADDPVPGRPVADAGVIDPSPFQADDGKRYVLYKTSKTPSSLRMLRVNDAGLAAVADSAELVQRDGIIENPVMVQRGDRFVLFASRFGYTNCSYATVWMRSTGRWDFAGATEHSLMTTSDTGICGPGGADVAPALDGGTRIFLHGWVCGTGTTPCRPADAPFTGEHRRVLYAAVLRWGADGATPDVGAFL